MRRTNLKSLRIWGCYLQGSRPRDQSGCRRQQQGVTAQKNPTSSVENPQSRGLFVCEMIFPGKHQHPSDTWTSLAGRGQLYESLVFHPCVISAPSQRSQNREQLHTRLVATLVSSVVTGSTWWAVQERDPQTPLQPQGQQWNSWGFISQLTLLKNLNSTS